MGILASARKHGISNADIRHALRNAMRQVVGGGDVVIVIGPARDGALLEVGVAGHETEDPRVIHAMSLRQRLYVYL